MKGQRVRVHDIGTGSIVNVRAGEEFGGTIYTVLFDDATLTPDGIFYARPFEVEVIDPATTAAAGETDAKKGGHGNVIRP